MPYGCKLLYRDDCFVAMAFAVVIYARIDVPDSSAFLHDSVQQTCSHKVVLAMLPHGDRQPTELHIFFASTLHGPYRMHQFGL